MLRFVFILLALFIFETGYSYNKFLKIRPFTTLGYTAGENVNVGNGSLFSYRFGIQPLYQLTRYVALGADLGYIHSFTTDYDASSGSKGRSSFGTSDFVHINFLADFSFYKNTFVLQTGLGTYIGAGDNSSEFALGFFLSGGFDIPLFNSKYVSLPLLTRFEFIFGEHDLVPITFMTGLTFKFR